MAKIKRDKTQPQKMAEKQLARIIDYKKTFSSEQGKRVLFDLMSAHQMMSPTYVKGDAIEMAFLEGQRSVVLRIMTHLKADAEAIMKYIEEAHDHVQN